MISKPLRTVSIREMGSYFVLYFIIASPTTVLELLGWKLQLNVELWSLPAKSHFPSLYPRSPSQITCSNIEWHQNHSRFHAARFAFTSADAQPKVHEQPEV